MNWIKSKDKLPATSGEYLHCQIGDDEASISYYDAKNRSFYWHGMMVSASDDDVWMEIPKPPEGMI